MKRSAFLAAAAMAVWSHTGAALAHPQQMYQPHEGRIWYDGHSTVEVAMTWHVNPAASLIGRDRFMEFDTQVPKGFITSCTTWTDLPRPYDDCGTGGTFEYNDEVDSYGFGTYNPGWIQTNFFYTARYTLSRTDQTTTGADVRFGAQETEMAPWCGYADASPWCLQARQSSRVHTGRAWNQYNSSASSWLTPSGKIAVDYKCDIWYDPYCGW
jgi:hypothetical protein